MKVLLICLSSPPPKYLKAFLREGGVFTFFWQVPTPTSAILSLGSPTHNLLEHITHPKRLWDQSDRAAQSHACTVGIQLWNGRKSQPAPTVKEGGIWDLRIGEELDRLDSWACKRLFKSAATVFVSADGYFIFLKDCSSSLSCPVRLFVKVTHWSYTYTLIRRIPYCLLAQRIFAVNFH